MRTRTAVVGVLVATPAIAGNPLMPHVNAGLEVMGGGALIQIAARTHVGASESFGSGRVQPSAALGFTLGAGYLDPTATTGEPLLSYLDYGPELQLGLRLGDGGVVDNRVFASVAVLFTRLDDRLMGAPTAGTRVSVGASIAEWSGRVGTGRAGQPAPHGYLLLVLPQQIELGWIRDAGSDRFGITLSYGI